jgi:hypothetical protein
VGNIAAACGFVARAKVPAGSTSNSATDSALGEAAGAIGRNAGRRVVKECLALVSAGDERVPQHECFEREPKHRGAGYLRKILGKSIIASEA